MPALRMKTGPITSLREEHILHVCRKSIKASKVSKPKRSHWPAIPDDNKESVILDSESPGENIEVGDMVDLRVHYNGSLSQGMDLIIESPDLASAAVRKGSQSTTILETLFSPIAAYEEDTPLNPKDDRETVDEKVELPHLIADDSDESSSTPNYLRPCHGSDCQIYDVDFVVPISEEYPMPISTITSNSDDHDFVTSPMLTCMEDECFLPCHDKSLEAINGLHCLGEESQVNMDDSYLYLAIHQVKPPTEEIKGCIQSTESKETDCFDPHLFIGSLPEVIETSSPCANFLPAKTMKKQKPVTLVLDLDETLVHSTLDHCEDADFTFPVFLNMKEHTVYVRQRPHLHMFLERVAEMFEIVIFTASQSIYAERLLDILDPDKKVISHRLYRESCTFSGGSYTKDLSILGVDLARVAIIDNSPQVFQLQVNNGIPIKSWFDDPLDCALISLLPFLETLTEADDVRPLIAKKFSNKE